MPPRNGLRQPYMGYPQVGAVHPVIANEVLRETINEFATIADNVFSQSHLETFLAATERATAVDPFASDNPNHHASDAEITMDYNPARYYRLFDPQRLELSVFDLDVPTQAAQRARKIWEKNDLGQVKKEIGNQAGRRLSNDAIKIVCNSVVACGGKLPHNPSETVRSKLALSIDPSSYDEDIETLFAEHEIIKKAIMRRIKGRYAGGDPVINFAPTIPFIGYKPHATFAQIAKVNGLIDDYLHENPITLKLDKLATDPSRLTRKQLVRY